MVRNGDPRARMLEVSRDGRKHSLPQLLDSSTAQVVQSHGASYVLLQSQSTRQGRKSMFPPRVSRLIFILSKSSMSFHVLKNCPSRWAKSIWDQIVVQKVRSIQRG